MATMDCPSGGCLGCGTDHGGIPISGNIGYLLNAATGVGPPGPKGDTGATGTVTTSALTIGTAGLTTTVGTSPWNGSAAATIDIDTAKVPRLTTNTNTFVAGTGATTLVVKQGATQSTTSLMEWQNTSGSALALVGSGGSIFSSANGGFGTTSALTDASVSARLSVLGPASGIGLIVKLNATTPGDFQQWQYSSGVKAAVLDNTGLFTANYLSAFSVTVDTVVANISITTSGTINGQYTDWTYLLANFR
jgi:hypothetical protein